MVAQSLIQDFVDRLVEKYEPEKVILFGSYAYGQPDESSDIDLCLVMSQAESPHKTAVRILLDLKPTFPIDLIVRTPQEVAQRLAWNDFFLQDIFEKGIVLHESAHA